MNAETAEIAEKFLSKQLLCGLRALCVHVAAVTVRLKPDTTS